MESPSIVANGAPPAPPRSVAPVIAHEMRTPLAVVVSAAETMRVVLMRADVDRQEMRRLAHVVERNGRLAAQLLDRLDIARDIDRGTVSLTRRRTDLSRLVQESVDDFADFVLQGHTLAVLTIGHVPVVLDDTAVREIILNLLSNAAKYSEPGAAIGVHVEQEESIARVVVRDRGPGVAPGDRERIFDQYEQGDPANPGLGLGLYVSRGLARAHGGELSVRAAATTGSEFVLELPAGPTDTDPTRT